MVEMPNNSCSSQVAKENFLFFNLRKKSIQPESNAFNYFVVVMIF
jgi:hypothetical protein